MMNERIKELIEQAYQWAVTESKGGQNVCAPGSDYFLAMEKEKFAELIVSECCLALWTEECRTSDLALEEYTRGSNKIREHFGVE
jgi:hypothetical protein